MAYKMLPSQFYSEAYMYLMKASPCLAVGLMTEFRQLHNYVQQSMKKEEDNGY